MRSQESYQRKASWLMQITTCACVAIAWSVYRGIQDAQSHIRDFNVASNLTVCDTTSVLSGTLTKEINCDVHGTIFVLLFMFLFSVVVNGCTPHKNGLPYVVALLIGICLVPIFIPLPVQDSLVNVSNRAIDFDYRFNNITCPANMQAVQFYNASTSGIPSDICHSQMEYFKHCRYTKSREGFVQFCCASFKPGLDHIDDIHLGFLETFTSSCFLFVVCCVFLFFARRIRCTQL